MTASPGHNRSGDHKTLELFQNAIASNLPVKLNLNFQLLVAVLDFKQSQHSVGAQKKKIQKPTETLESKIFFKRDGKYFLEDCLS